MIPNDKISNEGKHSTMGRVLHVILELHFLHFPEHLSLVTTTDSNVAVVQSSTTMHLFHCKNILILYIFIIQVS